ncbi:MAG TPA: hypothetical protein VGB74_20420 [Actinoplanes sp.]
MNDTALQSAPITLDRRLVLGDIDYQVTAFPTDDHRIDLCIVSSDGDGRVVSEISGGLAPADLTGLTDVLVSTLAGLIAMTQPPVRIRSAPPPDRQSRHPNQGVRWTSEDDERLVARYRAGARPRELMAEFGRSNGGIRSRLEHLGVLAPGGRWRPPAPPDNTAATAPPTPAAPDEVPPTTPPGGHPPTT